MEKFDKERLNGIQKIFEEKTGANLQKDMNYVNRKNGWIASVVVMAVCFISVSVLAFGRFAERNGNEEDIYSKHYEEEVPTILSDLSTGNLDEVEKGKKFYSAELAYENWVWPTESKKISALYGVGHNGIFSDHINIAGEKGDAIYSVTDGTVIEMGYAGSVGNYIVMQLNEETTVKYGHLSNIFVKEGSEVSAGDIIGEMGMTGMATGPNLYFAVYVNDTSVNPIQE